MTIFSKRAIFYLKLGVLRKNNLAEIIPFEPYTVKTDWGNCNRDLTLVIKNFNLKMSWEIPG